MLFDIIYRSERKYGVKVGFVSLGCPKNQLDTEVMLHEVATAGYEITPDETEADVVIINTCGFIESAKKESIENILDIAWLKKNRSLKAIVVTGCLAERYRESILEEMPEVDAVLGVGSIHNIVEAIEAVTVKKKKGSKRKYTSFEDKETVRLGGDRILTTPEYTAYLKIAEGCDNRCAYCAIPSIRGKFRSRTIEDIVEEAKQLEALGVRELNVVAQDITRYGLDIYGSYKLATLLRAITDNTSIPWIRLLYCYPDKITDELVAEIRDNDRILKYIDMPIQHISDNMLTAMNRHGDSAMIRGVIKKLRTEIPDIVIRTTFIVGFPGETERDFEELCEFVKESRFEHLGVFPYSREEDTSAYDFDGQIDEQIKQDRADIIMREQLEINTQNNEKMVGKTITVLCEDYDPVASVHFGRSAADAPEIDGKVYFKSERRIAPGSFVKVKIREVLDYDLFGRAIL
ncbi:MAG: 30S ribosomal protein S12 methylthiotransferase RimO [Ruminococcaceae bacterium]|nr:30S ribosomal protein S12 methylthiotransferase RimO [Oscillospiraceae bacterium]